MKELKEYLKVHEQIKIALIEFLNIKEESNNEKLEEWKIHYSRLHGKITYGPPDLPKIADSNFDGIHFQYITTFHLLYQNSDYYYAPENVLMHFGLRNIPLTVEDIKSDGKQSTT